MFARSMSITILLTLLSQNFIVSQTCDSRLAEIFISSAPTNNFYSYKLTAVTQAWDGMNTSLPTFFPSTNNLFASYSLPGTYLNPVGQSCTFTSGQVYPNTEGFQFTRCGDEGGYPMIASNAKYLFQVFIDGDFERFRCYLDYRDSRTHTYFLDIMVYYRESDNTCRISNSLGNPLSSPPIANNSLVNIWDLKNAGQPAPILSKSNSGNNPKLVWASYPEQVYASPTYKIYRQVNSGPIVEIASVPATTLFKVDDNVRILSSGGDQIKYTYKAYYQGQYSPASNLITYDHGLVTATQDPGLEKKNGQDDLLSKSFYLSQNYPNPFNPTTNIEYFIPYSSYVSLKVYDAFGQEVSNLVDEYKSEGFYNIEFKAVDLASGIYFYQLKTNEFVETKKLILLR